MSLEAALTVMVKRFVGSGRLGSPALNTSLP